MLKKLKEKYRSHKLHRAMKNTRSAFDDAAISWVAPEYVAHERGLMWKITMLVLVTACAGVSFYFGDWSFALAVLVFAGVYAIIHSKRPRNIEIKISNIGIKVGFKKYPYGKIKAFWLIYEPPFVQTLNIRVEGEFIGDITIQLSNTNPAAIREFLITKIPEMEGKSESLSDIFVRLFKI
jgi:hypothetical protein